MAPDTFDPDPEKKIQPHVTAERIGDQIPHELLEELAPNGEGDYILGIINSMSEEEAIAIIHESLEFHADDWNFPSDMRERMKRLLQGPKLYGEFYERDLRIDATMMRYSSPYPGVRAVTDPMDNADVPIETIRAYFLGIGWAVIGTFMATFFNSRFPSIGLSGSVIQILLFPCAKFLELVLPDWGVTVMGIRHSLNPGPWTFKEQMFATITFNIAIYTTNSYTMILVQKSSLFYGETFITFGYQLMLTLFVQLMGMGFAGYLRRFSVYPVKALWPTVLPIIAMNRALTKPEIKENIYGWTISRYRFFYTVTFCMILYYWLPGYLFTALSTFNWMTWISPQNVTLAILTGSITGLGLFNPITTFDWNVATSSYAALAQPFFSTCTMYFGSVLGAFIILGIYYSNMYNTAYLPINSSSAFANDGTSYNVSKVVVNNHLNETLYQGYSPPFYSAGYILTVGANFAFYPVYFLYIMGNQWKTMKQAYIDFYQGLRRGKGNYEGAMDVHSRLMSKYKEVPDWWFILILLAALIVSIVFLQIYPLDTPVWVTFLMIGINIVFAVPLSFLSATTGTNLGLGSLIQIITGFALPENPNAFMFAQTLGSWALAGYGDNYVQDQKMAHYCKIAPRAVFRSQIGTIIITCFVAVGTQDFILNNVQGLCTSDQPSHFTCAGDGYPLYTSSLMWGLLGSNRMFNSLYPLFKWCFLIGFAVALIFLVGQGYGPKYLPGVREKLRLRLRPNTFELLDRTLFPFVASLLWLNPILIIQGIQHWAPSNLSYKTPGLILSFVFMYWLPRHRLAWWEKYNYVLSAALTAGVAICALIIFFAVDYHPRSLSWWGNKVSSGGVDSSGVGILSIPTRGYFGPEKGMFP
ncbi:OPT oligopeptide transporter protein-domain-containing protein [Talaromyces proteolyticus]|uniref:OPT oligopeptide transporter protein-domain-containing protein n=1 Tax=Talaromyces proteolyticus TaxID=1131652 RepID=A0AAD4KFP4_9EURO|nr:OPT oligopeptide transporter protein-domain-containing protein [Talaromyces proteolyticus]KAH8690596.1 OPT oligopeptide transporter protein-domain-containing protein [Talaromyces proteolyticus]